MYKKIRIKNNLYRVRANKNNEFKKLIPKKYFKLRSLKEILPKSVISLIYKINLAIDGWQLRNLPISRNRKRFNYIKKYYCSELVKPNAIVFYYNFNKHSSNNFIKHRAYKIPDANLYTIENSFITTPMSIINFNEKFFFAEHDDLNVYMIPDEVLDINLKAYCKTKKIRVFLTPINSRKR